MLVDSPRLTDSDRDLWQEYHEADMIGETDRQEAQSAEAIREFVGAHPSCYAGVSWGKDSVVIAHLLLRFAPHVPLVHLRPTNHNPDCDNVRDAYFSIFPGQGYREVPVDYSGINRVSLPAHELDKATDETWYRSIRDSESVAGGGRILGIRADESTGRAIRMFRWGPNTKNACAPIGFWKTHHVFSYLAKNNLPVHPAYAMTGGGRWKRERLRVAEIGDTHGAGGGRREWEREYYGDILSRLERSI